MSHSSSYDEHESCSGAIMVPEERPGLTHGFLDAADVGSAALIGAGWLSPGEIPQS